MNIIDTLPDQVTDTIVSGLLKKKADSTNEISSTAKQNVPFQLATEGSKSRVILINPKIKNPVKISHENLHDLQIGLGNLSKTKMKKVTNWVRTLVGRKSIPVGYKESLVAKSGLFSEEFWLEERIFEGNGTNKEVLRPVVYADCELMVSRICKER